ncbi:uncharacterized protein A4U43_C04F12640 [Asparagus officinalis]|uniref:F-box domain-containing protein n=1 Tax=Asparagus officinalis TaxID=4686 RepID=A0A5P1F564_ASPOF|nr:F-box protein At3g08750-like [Asparagus officinalis]ONK71811.1 uncharacterized protein A4U43_C04F12640 [Asparagus officinalis]
MSSLGEDLLIKILWKLPLESLLRFKLVSKAWNSWISHILSSTSGLIFEEVYIDEKKLPQSLLEDERERNILVDVCDGLLLFERRKEITYRWTYSVWNPITNQWFQLPQRISDVEHGVVGLGFDPVLSPHFQAAHFYKDSYVDGSGCTLELFSSQTGSWRDFKIERHDTGNCFRCRLVIVGRAVFVQFKWSKCPILKFDMDEESFKDIELPGPEEKYLPMSTLGKCEGRLHLAWMTGYACKIWKLEDAEQESRWVLLHTCSYYFLKNQACNNQTNRGVVIFLRGFLPDSKVVLLDVNHRVGQRKNQLETFSYDFRTRELVKIYISNAAWHNVFAFSPCTRYITMGP